MKVFRRNQNNLPSGDAIPFFHDGVYHLFYLTSPPGTTRWPQRVRTTWQHARSTDLVTWEELRVTFSRRSAPFSCPTTVTGMPSRYPMPPITAASSANSLSPCISIKSSKIYLIMYCAVVRLGSIITFESADAGNRFIR